MSLHHHHHGKHHETKNIKTAFFINIAFTIFELIGGLYTNSMAILSDAVHDFGDSVSLGIGWYFQKLSNKKSDAKFSYGYGRFSLVGAIINSIILLVGSITILYNTIPRIVNPEKIKSLEMLWIAVIGIIANGAAVLKLKHGNSLNERAVYLHLLEDVLGWGAVLIGSILMFFTGWWIIDPILSLLISLYILKNVYKNLKEGFNIILQGNPKGLSSEIVCKELEKINLVKEAHDTHIWTLDGSYYIASVHLVVPKDLSIEAILTLKKEARKKLNKMGIEHVTIEIEMENENCLHENCV